MRPIGTIDAKSSAVMSPSQCYEQTTQSHSAGLTANRMPAWHSPALPLVQPHDGMFTRDIRRYPWKRNQPCYRGGIDDHPSSLSQHLLDSYFMHKNSPRTLTAISFFNLIDIRSVPRCLHC